MSGSLSAKSGAFIRRFANALSHLSSALQTMIGRRRATSLQAGNDHAQATDSRWFSSNILPPKLFGAEIQCPAPVSYLAMLRDIGQFQVVTLKFSGLENFGLDGRTGAAASIGII